MRVALKRIDMAKKKEEVVKRRFTCGECVHCKPVGEFHTPTVKDGKPTLGDCPFMERRRVLLSEDSCKHFKLDNGYGEC